MRCHDIEPLLATRRDLPPAQEQQVKEHLAGCAACATAWQREQRTTQALQRLRAPATIPAPRAFVPPEAPLRTRLRSRGRARLALGGAALCLLLALFAGLGAIRSALGWANPSTGETASPTPAHNLSATQATPPQPATPARPLPPGAVLYQRRTPGGTSELWMINADGSDDHKVLVCPEGCVIVEAVLSRQGDAVAYLARQTGEGHRRSLSLRVATVDGKDDRELILDTKDVDNMAALALSPDGSQVALLRYQFAPLLELGEAEEASLWVVATAGGPPYQLVGWRPDLGPPAWYDSQHVLYTTRTPQDGDVILKHDVSGLSAPVRLAQGRLIALAPGRDRLVVQLDQARRNQEHLAHNSQLFRNDGQARRCSEPIERVAPNPEHTIVLEPVHCSFDAAGRLYKAAGPAGELENYTYNRNGGLESIIIKQGLGTSSTTVPMVLGENLSLALLSLEENPEAPIVEFALPGHPIVWAPHESRFVQENKGMLRLYQPNAAGTSLVKTSLPSTLDQPPIGDEGGSLGEIFFDEKHPYISGSYPKVEGQATTYALGALQPLFWSADGRAIIYPLFELDTSGQQLPEGANQGRQLPDGTFVFDQIDESLNADPLEEPSVTPLLRIKLQRLNISDQTEQTLTTFEWQRGFMLGGSW